jgi:CTP synthase (UTP-ammonia lyase)
MRLAVRTPSSGLAGTHCIADLLRIALVGDYDPAITAHQAIPRALDLSAKQLGREVAASWLHTSNLTAPIDDKLAEFVGIWCVPGSPYAHADGALEVIRFARESGRPFLGTCGGFQHALLEYARHVLGQRDAEHAEDAPDATKLLISRLSCSLVEKSGVIVLSKGSRLSAIYGADSTLEMYHCNFGLNPTYESCFDSYSDLHICGRDQQGEVRAVELPAHPFFVATLFQPERAALRGQEHPLVTEFVKAAANSVRSR